MVEVMGQKMCIINSYKVANDLLNERSLIYSDRPAMPMVNDLYASPCILFWLLMALAEWTGFVSSFIHISLDLAVFCEEIQHGPPALFVIQHSHSPEYLSFV
jgi:hypothetical protein